MAIVMDPGTWLRAALGGLLIGSAASLLFWASGLNSCPQLGDGRIVAYSGEVDRLLRRKVTGDSAESSL